MKNILLLSSLALVINATAQTTGKITYEEKIKLNIQIDDTDSNNEMLKNLPKEKNIKKGVGIHDFKQIKWSLLC